MDYPIFPEVSIIVPIYNSGKYVIKCLDSVRAQKFCNYELILIDDGSSDQTNEIVKKYIHKVKDNRILYYENRYNLGPSFSRNKGLYIARGKYVCFCDSDDILHPDFLKYMMSEIADNDFVYCGHDTIDMLRHQTIRYKWPYVNSSQEIKKSYLTSRIHFSHSACLYSRLFLLRHGLAYNMLCRQGEDIEFVCNVLLHNPCCKCIQKSLYLYRIRSNSLSTGMDGDGFLEVITMLHRVRHKIPGHTFKLQFMFGRCASHAYHIIKDVCNREIHIQCSFFTKFELIILSLYYIIHKSKNNQSEFQDLIKFIKL